MLRSVDVEHATKHLSVGPDGPGLAAGEKDELRLGPRQFAA